jgi:hypothetical protein
MAAGDHIAVERTKFSLGLFPVAYDHHGIDVGDGTVIHFTGESKREAAVVQTSVAEFLKGGEKVVIYYERFTDVLLNYKSQMQSVHRRDHLPLPLPFLDDDRIDEIRKRIKDPQRAVMEARRHLGRKGYDLFGNNCEHFAVFCKTGLAVSLQVIEYWKLEEKIAEALSLRADHDFPTIRRPRLF